MAQSLARQSRVLCGLRLIERAHGPSISSGSMQATKTRFSSCVSFQLVARQRQATVPRVRIQVISSPQDFGLYQVALANPLLSDVDIEASPDAIAEVEAGHAQVIAMIHLTTNDKERAVEKKAVSFFAIVRPDGTATPVLGTWKDNPHPDIDITITRVE